MSLRIEQRPVGDGASGHYRKSMVSGTMAAGLAADSEVFQLRYTGTLYCVVRRIQIDGLSGSATAFAAGFGRIYAQVARAWTADGTGGNTATITGNNGKLKTGFPTTGIGTIRCASTAALGAGTKTLETDAIGQQTLTFGTVANVIYLGQVPLLGEDAANAHPLVLGNQEGFAVKATVPATGTWQFGVTVDWAEVADI
jgi:hypothetical protein